MTEWTVEYSYNFTISVWNITGFVCVFPDKWSPSPQANGNLLKNYKIVPLWAELKCLLFSLPDPTRDWKFLGS